MGEFPILILPTECSLSALIHLLHLNKEKK